MDYRCQLIVDDHALTGCKFRPLSGLTMAGWANIEIDREVENQ